MDTLKARLDKSGQRVMCGTGCGTELAWVLERRGSIGRRRVWFPPGWSPEYAPGPSSWHHLPVWRYSQRGRRRPNTFHTTTPEGWVPYLPAEAACPSKGCGQRQTLDPVSLEVNENPTADRAGAAPSTMPAKTPLAGYPLQLSDPEERQRWEERLWPSRP